MFWFCLMTIISFKYRHTSFKLLILMVFDERCADAQTFLMATCRDETDSRNTIIHQLTCQLAAGHILIADGEIETIGYRTVLVFVIHNMEPVTQEDFLQFVGAITIYLDLVAEIVLAVAGCVQHRRHRVLGTVARS